MDELVALGVEPLYRLPSGVVTRWASPENPDGRPGAAATANHGRKGRPSVPLAAGETLVLARAAGSGVVRRIWATINDRSPEMLRGLVLRGYWDGAAKPAIAAPWGDFFGHPLGLMTTFTSAWFDSGEGRSFNCRLPMPFRRGFRLTVTNESPRDLAMLFYDVNFTIGDTLGDDCAYLHAHFRRENPTVLRRDFEILPRVTGRGRFLGANFGVRCNTRRYGNSWWGEGEVKMYLDGDSTQPTLCGTGTEDYIGTGWGQGAFTTPWHGCTLADAEAMQYAFYRWHGPDPVYFGREARITIQQIGCDTRANLKAQLRAAGEAAYILTGTGEERLTPEDADQDDDAYVLFERQDDWCATAFFYLDRPISILPSELSYENRLVPMDPA